MYSHMVLELLYLDIPSATLNTNEGIHFCIGLTGLFVVVFYVSEKVSFDLVNNSTIVTG